MQMEEADAKILREDPVYEKNGKWFFWDETWSTGYGPFDAEEVARKKCINYYKLIS